jgi:hypothetical protein
MSAAAARQRVFRRKRWLKKPSSITRVSGIECGLLTTVFGHLAFDRVDDPLIHICDPLRFIRVIAFFAYKRVIGEIFVM